MEAAVRVVAEVLQRLPEMVPQFSINQNPLTQLLEFFQGMNERNLSNSDARLRNPDGKFTDGEGEEVEV